MSEDKFVERLEGNLSALNKLLGADNVEEVKKRIADLIVERVASDIRNYDYYLFYPGNYQETIDEVFENISKKLTKMYKDAVLESAKEAVQRFQDIASSAISDTQGLQLRSCHVCKYQHGNKCIFYEDKPYYWIAHDTTCTEEGFVNFVNREVE